jgi:FMN phosphatase YigB (HAD superfamily)
VIRAVTLDAYGTVFDFESHLSDVAGEVLAAAGAGGVTPQALADAWSAHFAVLYEEFGSCHHADGRDFRTVAELTTEALANRQHGIRGLDPRPGVEIWLERLRAVRPFPEAEAVIAMLVERWPLAMLSDTDDDIIAPALERLVGAFHRRGAESAELTQRTTAGVRPSAVGCRNDGCPESRKPKAESRPFKFVLTSQRVRAYKQDPRAVLFRRALEELGLPAAEVLHVGDSTADIRGARTAGMRTAWVNRAGWPLPAGCPRPDVEIRDLAALPTIVESLS